MNLWHHGSISLPVIVQFLLCPVVFLSLIRITAPYGRHFSAGWGPVLPNRLAWLLMELPALVIVGLLLAGSPEQLGPVALLPWLMWSVHYAYRTFVFPALMRPSGKSFPAVLVVFAIAFNILNGYNNSAALIANSQAHEPLLTLHFLAGSLLFVTGFGLHVASDQTIRRLRPAGFSGYRIPQGGGFKWVSNPHYLGEIIQWSGWAILTWSWAGLAFALFTVSNLLPRALANHRWYQQRFPDYPARRKILIPGVL